MRTPKTKLSILIPVRNEGLNIGIMLKILQVVVNVPNEVLVIYDSQDDSSIPVIKEMQLRYNNIKPVHNSLGRGVINAIKAGLDASSGEYILLFAADEVGPVLEIDQMICLLDEGCDLVSCTRYALGGRRLGGSLVGGILSRIANKALCVLAGSVFTDATTGIKMFRAEIMDRINLESRPVGWAVVFELAVKAQAAGMKLGEVPIISIDRLYGGQSSFSLGPWMKEYLRWFIWGMKNLKGSKISRKEVRYKKRV